MSTNHEPTVGSARTATDRPDARIPEPPRPNAGELAPSDESYYRTHYEASAPPGGSWDHARPVYQLGHAAAANPGYRGRSFAEIETDLQHGWKADGAASPGDWQSVRDLARAAYEHRTGLMRPDDEDANRAGRAEGRTLGGATSGLHDGGRRPGA